ncbi:pentatricopeptide repeat-containing protein At1g59720, chloroplastic/mitochondrial [Silene latifolia]|uniref:pentatricopeptide repeat-containing protein At1g59720, chloroplastic/mitochondrial n=1 Tax=Silene latifolia TaxID=37657 RepID=UPI003D77964B
MLLTSTTNNPPPHINHSHNHGELLSLLNQCTTMANLKQLHAQTLRTTPFHHPTHLLFLQSRLLHYYTSFSDIRSAFRLFDTIENPNTFMWNTLIRACAHSQSHKGFAFMLYCDMLRVSQVTPDKHTFPFVLKACAYLFDHFGGKQIHAHVFKLGFWSDVYVNNSLIHFYASCGELGCARKVFDEMPERSVVSWNAMIDGLVVSGEFDAALSLFCRMQREFDPDGYTLKSVVMGCAGLGALSSGMWVHAYVLRGCDGKVGNDVLLNNALVEMYFKCGMFDLAIRVFDEMGRRDINSWNSMILGLAIHGLSKLALEYFDEMTKVEGLIPNSVTFVGILSACNHGGMVELGREYFDKMVNDYSIEPRLEHYGCLVDLLARAGFIYEALDLVSSMPMKPDIVIWRSLLDACCKQNVGLELSEQLANKILESEDGTSSGVYVLLSKVYASAARWNNVGLIRQLMTDKGIRKEPGCSSLEINGVNHEFFAGDTSHPERKDIYKVLEMINEKLESVGYKSDLSQAPLVDDEDENSKKDALKLHSERFAIAYGLLHLEHGVPIRVFKNLRVCNDCHEVIKRISKLFDVEVIVRDRIRFHHFRDGACSCSDYW